MVTKSASPEYVLSEVGIAAKQLKIEFRGRKTRLDALNLNYQLNDISLNQVLSARNYYDSMYRL